MVPLIPLYQVAKDVDEYKLVNHEMLKSEKDLELKPMKSAKPATEADLKPANNPEVEPEKNVELKPAEDVGLDLGNKAEELTVVKDIEEMKFKLNVIESKLREVSISRICFNIDCIILISHIKGQKKIGMAVLVCLV